MISKIFMPELGATGGDVILQEWLAKPGEMIRVGEPLFVVITDKASVEVEAYRNGVLREVYVSAGDTIPLGAILGLISDSIDEPLDQLATRATDTTPQPTPQGLETSSPKLFTRPTGRVLATPLARRIALEAGVDLSSLRGTGAQGEVLKQDVLAALEALSASRENARHIPVSESARLEPLTPMRRAIAERALLSKSQIPHYYATITIDMGAAQELRRQLMGMVDRFGWELPSYTDLCLRALALALKDYPGLNASFVREAIRYHSEINLGLVVGLETGMIIPVIRSADRLSLFTLATETKRLSVQAHSGLLSEKEMAGGTFTLSNLGMFGLDSFIAVINPPEAGILALGAIKEQPASINGKLAIRPLMIANLSVDHRVVDGITAAKFLRAFKDFLENPSLLLLEPPEEVDQP